MGTKLEELYYELSARTDKLDSNLKTAVSSMDKAEKKMTASTASLEKKSKMNFGGVSGAASVMAGVVGGNLVLGAFNKLASFVGTSFNNLRAFSSGIAEINTLLPRNAKLTKDSADQFLNFAKMYGQSTRTQTKAFYDIVSAGVKGTALQMRVLDQANRAAVAGITDVGTAADVLTSIMNAYASSGIEVTEISDQLFGTIVAGKTTFGELASTIGQVAPVANNANLSFAELSGTMAFLTKSGLSTAEATTGVKAVLTGIIKPAAEVSEAAKNMGIDFSVSAIKAKGFAGFMEEVRQKTGGSTEAIAKLFPNVKALGPILSIVNGNAEEFNQILKDIEESGGSTSKALEDVKEGLDFKLDRASKSLETFGIKLMGIAEGAIGLGADFVSAVFSPIIEGGEKAKPSIEKTNAAIEILKKQLAGMPKEEGFLDKLFGKREAVEDRIKELEGVRDAMQAAKDAGKAEAGGGLDPNPVKVFTQAQKEAAKAGRELSSELTESATSIEGVYNRRVSAIERALQKEVELQRKAAEDGTMSKTESLKRIQELETEAYNNKVAVSEERRLAEEEQLAAAREQDLINEKEFKDSMGAIEAQANARREEETNKSNKNLNKINKAQRDLELQQRADFLSTAATLAKSENKALAAIGKAAAITQIAIKTPPAIANSFEFGTKLGGPIVGGVFAGIAGAAMGAQAAAIAGVPLQTGLTEVPAGFPNDTFPARLETGERVVQGEQNQDLKEFLESQKEGGGGPSISVTIQGDVFDSEETGLRLLTILRDFQRDSGGELIP